MTRTCGTGTNENVCLRPLAAGRQLCNKLLTGHLGWEADCDRARRAKFSRLAESRSRILKKGPSHSRKRVVLVWSGLMGTE